MVAAEKMALAEQFLFDIFQGIVDFHQDKFIRHVFIEFRHIKTEYFPILIDQSFHVGDDVAAMPNQFHLFDYCHFILSFENDDSDAISRMRYAT